MIAWWMKGSRLKFKWTHQRMEMLLCQAPGCRGESRLSLTILHRDSGDSQESGIPVRTPAIHCLHLNSSPSWSRYLREEKLSEAVSSGQLLGVARESVQEEEHVAWASHSVTDAGPLPQQSSLPAEVSGLPEDVIDDLWCSNHNSDLSDILEYTNCF